jgi:predicted CopG family antitoxin
MRTITIRGIDDSVAERLRRIAKDAGKSVNQLLVDLIRREVGLGKQKKFTTEYTDLDHLFGKWSEAEFQEIQVRIDSERRIDEELWGAKTAD